MLIEANQDSIKEKIVPSLGMGHSQAGNVTFQAWEQTEDLSFSGL